MVVPTGTWVPRKKKLIAAFVAVAALGPCFIGFIQWTSNVSASLSNTYLQSPPSLPLFSWVDAPTRSAVSEEKSPVKENINAAASTAADYATFTHEEPTKRFKSCSSLVQRPLRKELVTGQIAYTVRGDRTTYLYAAHYDDRYHSVMLIMDAVHEADGPHHCQLWFRSRADPYVAAAHVFVDMPSGGNPSMRHNFVYSCDSPSDLLDGEVPFAVGLVLGDDGRCSQVQVVAKVEYSLNAAPDVIEFGVCVSPFSKNYANVVRLIEFIEINRLFGAQKFVFFNYSSSTKLVPVLQSYIAEGVVDVIQFPLYPNAHQLISYYAQQAAFYDCTLRYLNTVKFFAVLDLDEFIVPRLGKGVSSWSDLVLQGGSTVSAFIIRNVFYKLEWPDDGPYAKSGNLSLEARHIPPLQSLQKVWRERLIWGHGQRSKYIVRTRDAQQLLVHVALVNSGTVWKVPEALALLHHYRDWEDVDSADTVRRKGVYDDFLLRHGEAIVERVQGRLVKLG